jgi:calcium binding protein 39
MPLFGGKHKTPQELVRTIKDCLTVLAGADAKDEKKSSKALEDLSKSLDATKTMLCGSGEHEPNAETATQLAQEIYSAMLIQLLIEHMTIIDFEGRKDSVAIINNLLRRQIGVRFPTVEYICQHRDILTSLMTGYKNQELALNCGVMLRECFRHEELARSVLQSDDFYRFFDYVEVSTFDISSDAFLTSRSCSQDTRCSVLSSWRQTMTKSLVTIRSC